MAHIPRSLTFETHVKVIHLLISSPGKFLGENTHARKNKNTQAEQNEIEQRPQTVTTEN